MPKEKQTKPTGKTTKGLTDEEFARKYEAGKFDLHGMISKTFKDDESKKPTTETAKKKGWRVARVIAKILSFIIPYFKAKK